MNDYVLLDKPAGRADVLERCGFDPNRGDVRFRFFCTGEADKMYDLVRTLNAPKVACPHWERGRITMRKGCTACEAEQATSDSGAS